MILLLIVSDLYSATIKGKVKDITTGKALVGATMILVDSKSGAITDSKGNYQIKGLESGTLSVTAKYIGYKKQTRQILILKSDDEVTLNFSMVEEGIKTADVIVEARADKELESSARQSEKQALNVINVITAETIDHSTDKTAADALQRVSGLSLYRDQGEGRYVIMRGLEQRFSNTLVNGVKIPSPESKDRFVPLDIFPSTLLERIEVTKALTPDMEGDAIGGTTNLVIREAGNEPTLFVNAYTGYSEQLLNSKFYTFNKNAVSDLDPDRKYGSVSDANPTVLVTGRKSVTSSDFSYDNLKFKAENAPVDQNFSIVSGARFFDQKFGIIGSGVYQNTYNSYLEDDYSMDNSLLNNNYIPVPLQQDGRYYSTNKTRLGVALKTDYIFDESNILKFNVVYVNQEVAEVRFDTTVNIGYSRGSADFTYDFRSALRYENVKNLQLEGSHRLSKAINLKWTGTLSDAVQDRPDEAQIEVFQNYDNNHVIQPFQGLNHITRSWRKNDDKQYLGKIDIDYLPDFIENLSFKGGGLIQTMSRANFENDYTLSPIRINGQTQPWNGVDSAVVTPSAAYGNPVFGYQNYQAKETILSGYLSFYYILDNIDILGGARFENTHDNYYTAAAGLQSAEAIVNYTDILPSLHIRYRLNSEEQIRFSIVKTLIRPGYFDLVPAQDRTDIQTTTGNPYLKPSHSLNIDARYEIYPAPTDIFSLGVYFKKIDDEIEVTTDYSDPLNTIIEKKNVGIVYAEGFELVGAKHFGNFAVVANYSFINTNIKTLKYILTKDASGNPVIPVPSYIQSREMVGASPHILNLSLIYDNKDWGTTLQTAYNLTGKRLELVNPDDGMDQYQLTIQELDFSFEQNIFKSFKVYLKMTNLLNTPTQIVIPSGQYKVFNTLTQRIDYNKMRANIGFSYKL
ncbi:MAG: TonB-dependent receptor [FCB group bacterium]